MTFWLVAVQALGGNWSFDDQLGTPPALYPGTFDRAPVAHWSTELPSPRLNVATHTERGRPVIVGPHILVGSAGGSALHVLSRRNGQLVRHLPATSSVESEPLVVGDHVYFGDTGGTLWCYSLDGEAVWSRHSGAPILVRPTVVDGVLYITNVDDLGLAIDAETGDLLWRYAHPEDVTREAELALYAAPSAVVHGDAVLMGFSDGTLAALRIESGDVMWAQRVGEGRYPDLVASPVAHGTDIFTSGYFMPLVALDLASQNMRWRVDHGAAHAVAIDDSSGVAVVHHPGTDGTLRSYVALTGAERWSWSSGTRGALTTPQPTPAGLVVASSEGSVYLIDPDTGQRTWRYRGDELLTGVSAAPFIEGRQMIFVTNAGRIYSMVAP